MQRTTAAGGAKTDKLDSIMIANYGMKNGSSCKARKGMKKSMRNLSFWGADIGTIWNFM